MSEGSLASELYTTARREDILATLREADGGLRRKTIATETHTSKAAALRHLKALQEVGKVERYQDPDDRRFVRYRLRGDRG